MYYPEIEEIETDDGYVLRTVVRVKADNGVWCGVLHIDGLRYKCEEKPTQKQRDAFIHRFHQEAYNISVLYRITKHQAEYLHIYDGVMKSYVQVSEKERLKKTTTNRYAVI